MTTLVAATRNPAKLRELRRVVGDLAALVPPPDDISLEMIETGESVEEIAVEKAKAWSAAVGRNRLVIASDGGLSIPALGRLWQPVHTKRFAGDAADDAARAAALLELTRDLRGEDRRIGWREAIAIARDGATLATWSAESAPGLLATGVDVNAIAAGGGFWVPAMWICPEFGGKLLVELTPDEADRLDDHWSRLTGPVREWLGYLNETIGGEGR